jgi:hypothetical protein
MSMNESVGRLAVIVWRAGRLLQMGPRLLQAACLGSMCTGQMASSSTPN